MTIQPEQRKLVRESFERIAEVAGPVSLLFYGRLFELDPALRPMFRQDIELQGRKLMDMLTAVLAHLDDLAGLAPALHALGQRHAGYGVVARHYDTVERALLWAIGQALDGGFSDDVRAAWLSVIRAIAKTMKEGAALLPPVEP